VPLRLDPALADWTVIDPKQERAIADPGSAFRRCAEAPIGSRPLREMVRPGDRVVIVTSDGTRAVPNKLLIPLILEELPVPASQVTVILGTGTHRPNTPAEIEAMFGADLAARVRIVNHDGFSSESNVDVGRTADGYPVLFNREYVEADVRIAVGFIEPHFFAGFSGGAKGIMPGIAHVDTIYSFHRFEMIAHPLTTYGILEGNPTQKFLREATALAPPHFLINVTLNTEKEVTGFYLGHYLEAHEAGCAQVKSHAMAAVAAPCDVVVTTNSGFPLDQNLYQSVKALSAAARIVATGGIIVLVSECSDGLPSHGNFGSLLQKGLPPGDLLAWLRGQKKTLLDQWQAQTLAATVSKARVAVHSALPADLVVRLGLEVAGDLQATVDGALRARGPGARAAVMPSGPLTIPYLRSSNEATTGGH